MVCLSFSCPMIFVASFSRRKIFLRPAKSTTSSTKSSNYRFQDGVPFRCPRPSRKGGGRLDASAVHRIVRNAARRAGVAGNVSPHWLRHAHASHALDRGAPAHLVQQTLGHSSLAVTSVYAHARPSDSSARFLAV